MPELTIEFECTFRSKKSKKIAQNILGRCTETKAGLECLKEIEKKLSKENDYVEDLYTYIANCHDYELKGPFRGDDTSFRFNIWGQSDVYEFLCALSKILLDLKAQQIYAICHHDDGFEWFSAIEEKGLEIVYITGDGGAYDEVFYEEGVLSQFIELYKQKKLGPQKINIDKFVKLCREGKDPEPFIFQIDDINQTDSKGELPLIAAVKSGIPGTVNVIIKMAKPNEFAQNASGETAISVATKNNNKRIIEILEDYTIDPTLLSPDAIKKAFMPGHRIKDDPLTINRVKHLSPEDTLSIQFNPIDKSLRMIVPGEDGLAGIMDGYGNIIVKPQFIEASSFSEGAACVRKTWGEEAYFVDSDGNHFPNIRCNDRAIFNDGMAAVNFGNPQRSAIININGDIIIELASEYYFGDTSLYFTNYYYHNYDHEPVILHKHVPIKKNMLSGVLNSSGEIIVEPQYEELSNFYCKRARYQRLKDIYGIIDTEGNRLIEGRFHWLTHYAENIAIGRLNGITKYYDINGKVLFENDYFKESFSEDYCGRMFHNGLLAVRKLSKGWGFIDKKGQLAIACEFDEVGDFLENVTVACYKGQWGLLTTDAVFRPFNMKRPKLAMPRFFLKTVAKGVIGVFDQNVDRWKMTAFINLDGKFIYRLHKFEDTRL